MINRRDAFGGLILIAALFCFVLLSFLLLTTLTGEKVYISKKSVAVIEILGPIYNPQPVVNRIEQYITHENIPAIVLRLNTPGGGISATQEIYETVLKARSAGKIVVASMGAVAASGGYYIAAACDTVMATPGTITGSIGVIFQFAEFSGFFEKLGMSFNVRKSGTFKDTGSFSRKMTDEEKELIDGVIADTYDQFLQAVTDGRQLDKEYVRTYADGRIFSGRQAKELGFVDVTGTYQDAIDLAGIMVGLDKNPPVIKETGGVLKDLLIDGASTIKLKLLGHNMPSILYMWGY
ncbi:hypothetical protein ES708_02347 [subsurface metagenome]